MIGSIRQASVSALLIAALWMMSSVPAAGGEGALHQLFDELLRENVNDGVTSYAGFAKSEAKLDEYLQVLAATDPEPFSREEKLAFWINAYNAFTVKLILNHYPGIESIRDISRSDRWNWQGWTVNGRKVSLDEIEHRILRPMGEPRIHFAINCASYSCPDLATEAYVAAELDSQLDRATRHFLADETKGFRRAEEEGRFGGTSNAVYLSEIFHWFEGDFKESGGSRIDFVLPYTSEADRAWLKSNRYHLEIKKLEYDWSLNGN